MEEKKHVCKYCGKEFDKGCKLGAHIILCELNPKSKDNRQRISTNASKHNRENSPKLEFIVKCEYCNKEYTIITTQHKYDIGSYRHTCCNACAHKLSSKKCDGELKNKKIREGLRKYHEHHTTKCKTFKIKTCDYCGKEYSTKDRGQSIYCSNECMKKSRYSRLSAAAIKNKCGGLKPETTHKYYKRGYYKGIWCDSSWELAYVIYCLEHNISIQRNKDYIEYSFNDEVFKFYPDFIVDGKLVEIKGFYTPKNSAKKEQIDNVEFIDRSKIQPYLKYTISKYGKDFIKLYENAG